MMASQGIGWCLCSAAVMVAALGVVAAAVLVEPSGSSESPGPGRVVELVAARTVTVTSVTDGDTFDTSDGQTVRVLGIDSCESSTPRGPEATAEARRLLTGQVVTLVEEPGVDTDRFGRQLRYVQLPAGGDYGLTIVGAPHTGVYQGNNDAGPAYMSGYARPMTGAPAADPLDRLHKLCLVLHTGV